MVQMQRSVPRIGRGAIGQRNLEETLSIDGEVERITGLLHVALRMNALGRDRPHAGADLQSGG